MCGIVGVLESGPVAGSIVDALKRLEYRGYDSAGVGRLKTVSLDADAPRASSEISRRSSPQRRSCARSASANPKWS